MRSRIECALRSIASCFYRTCAHSRYAPLKQHDLNVDVHNVMQIKTQPRAKTNRERQAAWRAKHRPPKNPRVQYAMPQPPTPAELPPPATPLALEDLGPEALFENHIRKMPPAKKLYLAMLIMDDLNAMCGKRKARRNPQYVVQALTYANELAALPQPMLEDETVDAPALERHIETPLLGE